MAKKPDDTLQMVEISGGTDDYGNETHKIVLQGSPEAIRAAAHLFLQEVRLVSATAHIRDAADV